MDAGYESNLGESSQHVVSTTCAFCHAILSLDFNDPSNLDPIIVCGDCKFLLLEDLETTSPYVYPHRLSRRRGNSSESIESIFSQRFSQLVNQARQNHQPTSSQTTPSGSRRWRGLFSDTESDGFYSMYGEMESNNSFGRFSAYEGDSDGSLHDYGPVSDLESDTDIDPMNAGLYRWDSEEDDSDWEEADIEIININTPESLSGGDHERISQRRNYLGESGDYVGGFENLLQRLAETESSIRGAPPASASFIKNMPCVTVDEEGANSMACAVCKDSFIVGSVVNQLPCFHLFHPSCILPWLSSRNTCPVCRREVPTDDKDYEERKRNEMSLQDADYDIVVDGPSRFQDEREENEVVNADSVGNDGGRNRWLFLAAPIVGMVGITLMLCFGSRLRERKGWKGQVPQRRAVRWFSFF